MTHRRRRRFRSDKLDAELREDRARRHSDKCEHCGGRWGRHYPTCAKGGHAYDEDLHPHS